MKNAAILGASGYTGAEAVRLMLGHPKLKLQALTGHSRAGQNFADIYPNFSQDTIAQITDKVETIIDLSADFRLWDPAVYEATYGRPHDNQDLLKTAVYGLTELNRDALKSAKLIACPGCYPTP